MISWGEDELEYKWSRDKNEPDPSKGEKDYIIEVEKRIVCFGTPGSIKRWEYFMSYNDAKSRDKQLEELRHDNPLQKYRGRDVDLWLDWYNNYTTY